MVDTRRLLTVRLSRDGVVLRRSHHLGDRKLAEAPQLWASLGKDLRIDDTSGLDAIARLLDRGDGRELLARLSQSRLTDVGEILFATLFGPPEAWEPVLRIAFGQPEGTRPPPTFDAVRLRIVTTDPDLLGMPWRLTSWQGKRLVEGVLPWTFEVSAVAEPSHAVQFPRPARVLVVAPEVSGLADLEPGQHVAELAEALTAVSPTYRDAAFFRVAKTDDDLVAALRGMRPHLVYYYGHAEVLGGQATLSLAGPDGTKRPLIMDDFKRRMAPLPLAVFVNGCMSGASGWHSVGHKLSPEVPVVVSNRTTSWTGHAGPAAIRWLQELIGGDRDPVALLDTLDAAATTRDFQWATTIVHTGYLTWTASEAEDAPRAPVGLRLDRLPQRNAAFGQVTSLVQGREKRVEAILACGERGNHVEKLGDQLFDYLEMHGRQIVRTKRLCLHFPDVRADLVQGLEDELRRALGVGEHDNLQHAVRRFLPRADASRSTPLLWIDWGTFGSAVDEAREGFQPPTDELQRAEWLELCSKVLVDACPAECRIVSFLATEIAPGIGASLRDEIDMLRLDLTSDAFGCQLLPELPGLTVMDIYEYLREPRNTGCPPGTMPQQMAKLIHQATHGNYEQTVALIHEAEPSAWTRLKAKLSHQEGPDLSTIDRFRLVSEGPLDAPARRARRESLEARQIPKTLGDHRAAAPQFQPGPALTTAVNLALSVGAPLLLTGEPGTGKTQVAHYLAWYFDIEQALFPLFVRSTTTASDLVYRFDAVGYFHAASDPARRGERIDRAEFIDPGPLWRAYEHEGASLVLIDEIDKAPRDFPNDLLHVLDQHSFDVPEARRKVSRRADHAPPIVVITSNSERRLPEPFLRRCIFHHIDFTEDLLRKAVAARAGDFPRLGADVREAAIKRFLELRGLGIRKKPATAELLVWLTILSAEGGHRAEELLGCALKDLPALAALVKDHDDLGLL